MIPCTEFIPLYSEFFKYLEAKRGFPAVECFWAKLFKPDGKGIPLVTFIERAGLRGCYEYWSHSLNEEAADFTLYLNEKRGFFLLRMHHCPSKGRLLEQRERTGVEPYAHYCLHCDHYRAAAEKCGLKYLYDFCDTDRAACSILIYDPRVFDGRVIPDAETQRMDRRAAQNEYFHRGFHHSLNRCIYYMAESLGEEGLREMFAQYVHNVQAPLLGAIRAEGLAPLEAFILSAYRAEKAPDAAETERTENTLAVRVKYCPAVRWLREQGHAVCDRFSASTEYVMAAIAAECGLTFEMQAYDPADGRAAYCFRR